jgi:heme/copper-type cytochrome/quinol oxidase subunit 2
MYYRDKDGKIIKNKDIREGYNSTEYYGKGNKKLSWWWILIIALASLIIVLLIAWLIWWAAVKGKKKRRFYSPTVSRFRFGHRFY